MPSDSASSAAPTRGDVGQRAPAVPERHAAPSGALGERLLERALELRAALVERRHDERDPRVRAPRRAARAPTRPRSAARRAASASRTRGASCPRRGARTSVSMRQPPRSSRSNSACCRGVGSSRSARIRRSAARGTPRRGKHARDLRSVDPAVARRARRGSARRQARNARKSLWLVPARSRSRSTFQCAAERQASAAQRAAPRSPSSSAPSVDSAMTRRQSASACAGASGSARGPAARSQRRSSQAAVGHDRRRHPSATRASRSRAAAEVQLPLPRREPVGYDDRGSLVEKPVQSPMRTLINQRVV